MNIRGIFGRVAVVAAAVTSAVAVAAGSASAGVVAVVVMNTGSEGPVMGCPHTVAAGISAPTGGSFDITADGARLAPVTWDARTDSVLATWIPNRLGWHTLEVTQHYPRGDIARGRLDIEVRRAGVNAGSSCIANGIPLPINPQTGTLG